MPGLTCHRQLVVGNYLQNIRAITVMWLSLKRFTSLRKGEKNKSRTRRRCLTSRIVGCLLLRRQLLELANGTLSDSEIEIDAQAEEDDSDSEDNEDESQEEAQHQDQDPQDQGSEESESDESKREESESDDDSDDDDSDIEEERDEYNNGFVPHHDLQSDENQSSDEEQNDEDPHLLPPPKKTTNAIIFARGEKIEQLVGNKRQKTNWSTNLKAK